MPLTADPFLHFLEPFTAYGHCAPGLAILPFLVGIVPRERKLFLVDDAFFDVWLDANGGIALRKPSASNSSRFNPLSQSLMIKSIVIVFHNVNLNHSTIVFNPNLICNFGLC